MDGVGKRGLAKSDLDDTLSDSPLDDAVRRRQKAIHSKTTSEALDLGNRILHGSLCRPNRFSPGDAPGAACSAAIGEALGEQWRHRGSLRNPSTHVWGLVGRPF